MLILAFLTDTNKSANFQDVVYSMCGKRWQTINSICIILYMFGCCITFFIIIGDQLDQGIDEFILVKVINILSINWNYLQQQKKSARVHIWHRCAKSMVLWSKTNNYNHFVTIYFAVVLPEANRFSHLSEVGHQAMCYVFYLHV